MEKQSTSTKKHRYYRLLNAFGKKTFFVFVFLYSSFLLLQGEESKVFLDISENTSLIQTLVLEIPQITPSRIHAEELSLLDGVKIIEYNKTAQTIERSHGTRLTLVLEFSKVGVWNLEDVPITIDKKIEYVHVPEIVIVRDLATVKPEAYFELQETCVQGQSIIINLWVKNCNEITAVQNDLSKNSIFELKSMVQDLPYYSSGFTEEAVLIAKYNFTPLEDGQLTVPTIKIAVTTFANKKTTIDTQLRSITVFPATTPVSKTSVVPYVDNLEQSNPVIQQDKTTDVLFAQEVASSVASKVRLLDIMCKIILFLGIVCVVFIIMTFFMHRKQKMLVLVLAFVSLISVCFLSSFVSKRRAVCYQTELQTIPENNASIRSIIENGDVVVIKSESANWYLIQLSDKRSGWIPCDKCINVK